MLQMTKIDMASLRAAHESKTSLYDEPDSHLDSSEHDSAIASPSSRSFQASTRIK